MFFLDGIPPRFPSVSLKALESPTQVHNCDTALALLVGPSPNEAGEGDIF